MAVPLLFIMKEACQFRLVLRIVLLSKYSAERGKFTLITVTNMAYPLLSLESKPFPPFRHLHMHESTAFHLLRTFQDKSNVLPLLFLSQLDLSAFLQALIEEGLPNQYSNFDLTMSDTEAFVSKGLENPVVYVWPLPVQLQGFSLMLVHMWDYDVNRAEDCEAAHHALSGLIAIAGF
jgi:hypothetical protein